MGLSKFRTKNLLVVIIAAAACASVAASITDDKKDISLQSTEESRGNLREKISSSYSDAGSKSSGVLKSANNTTTTTTTTKHGRKIVHRLIGGHVRVHPKEERREEELEASSAGNGKEKSSARREDEEEKKSLSQQVKEGKYGLIQNEIYPRGQPKRPGVISYLGNPEVPRDTARNYGGLEEEEIWLAENHLLVLRGGNFPSHGKRPENKENPWPAIDDYDAPKRQVKIPARPEVPPPFPVQLTEGGPVQIIRANGSSSILNDTADYEEYANYPEGFFPGEAPFYPTSPNATAEPSDVGSAVQKASTSGEPYLPPASGTDGPFYSSLPPGAVFLPPPSNRSDDYDEDDQSIYYPPPYSFFYEPREKATAVPPGPLVPGIILPPPPNFFAALKEPQNSETTKPITTTTTTTTTSTVPPEETTTYVPPRRKTIAKPLYKHRITTTTPVVPTYAVTSARPTTRTRLTTKTLGKTKSRIFSTPRYVLETTTVPTTTTTTTTSVPEKTTTLSQNEYYDVETEVENHLVDLGPPQGGEWSGIVSTTSVPLLAYFATTSSSAEGTRTRENFAPIHVEAEIPKKNQPAAYYFYEETNASGSKSTPAPQVYYETSTPSPYYNIQPLTSQRQPKKQYYSVEMIPSQQTADDYESKLAKAGQTYSEFPAQEPAARNHRAKYNVERIRSQNLADNSHRYYQPATVKPFYTTQRPRFYYRAPEEQHYDYRDERELKSNPVYQYNYESNDYAKPQQGYVDYRQPPSSPGNQYYEYDSRPVERVQQKYAPRAQRPVYSTGTTRPFQNVINTTPNPEHAYYTKQEEQLLDDVTKQYFTIFGKKLPSEIGIQSTTPLYPTAVTTTENPLANIGNTYLPNSYNNRGLPRFKPPKVKVHYGDQTQRPYSLEGDTLVNYKHPLPAINPDAEYINGGEEPAVNRDREEFETEQIPPFRSRPVGGNYAPREIHRERYPATPISLANDIAVNYHNPRPAINPDAEFVPPVNGQANGNGNRGGSYFAYKLPGNGGHFYFLTPQAISQSRQNLDRQYFYPKPFDPRPVQRRRRRGPADG